MGSVIGTTPDFGKLVDELRSHASLAAMAAAVRHAAETASSSRNTKFPLLGSAELVPPDGEDPAADWNTPQGNVWEILRQGASSADHVALARTLLAFAVKNDFPSSPEQERGTAASLVWLAAHTPCSAFEPLDYLMGDEARPLWSALAPLIEDPSLGGADFGRTEALIAAVCLHDARSDAAREVAHELVPKLEDPALRNVLAPHDPATPAEPLTGEISPAPKSAWLTALLAFTLVLGIMHVGRLVARYAFAYKRPAKVVLSQRGLEVTYHTELLGKVLRQRATLVPLSNLASVTREVRFARLGMYAGLVALVLGSYVGMGLFIDGLRVPGGSATLLGLAVVFILVGLLIDFGLSSLSDSVKGKCRLVVVPRKGRAVCVGSLSPSQTDAVLSNIAERAGT